jgi:alpha-mannosidase
VADRSFWQGLGFWVDALDTWAVQEEFLVPDVRAQYRRGDDVLADEPVPWGGVWSVPGADVVVLSAKATLPAGRVRLVVDVEGEGLLRVDGAPAWGVNANHREADLSREAGRTVGLELFVVPRAAFGRPLHAPRFGSMRVRRLDPAIEKVRWDLAVLIELARRDATPLAARHWLEPRVLEALEPLTTMGPDLDAWRARAERRLESSVEAGLVERLIVEQGEVVGLRRADRTLLRAAIQESGQRLEGVLGELQETWPAGPGRLVAIGHAHIDLAWLWPIGETRRKIVRTVATQDRLLDGFPDWPYLMSSPEMWLGVEETEPDLFNRMRRQVEAGRIVPAGATWVECDAQLPSAAAVVRHLRYAGRYFLEKTGQRPEVAFLPDTFGFAGGWPTLLGLYGVRMMVTTKLLWNDTTQFPYTDFGWVGPDGSTVAVQVYGGAAAGYNGSGTLDDLDRAWGLYEQRGGTDRVLYTFGFGDGGGGPTREMLERLTRYRNLPMVPRVAWGSLQDLIPSPAALKRAPHHRGDLYLEYHRGVFTTQTLVKRENRRLETHLNALEAWSAALMLDGSAFADQWRRVLRNQFHDILPGSSIAEVYRDWREDMAPVQAFVDRRFEDVLDAIGPRGSEGEAVLAVANAAGVNVPPGLVVFSADRPPEVEVDGAWRRALPTHDGRYVLAIPGQPALSVARYRLRPAADAADGVRPADSAPRAVTVPLPHGTVTVAAEGIASLVHRGRELVVEPAGVRGFFDHPAQYDAWELSPQYREQPVAFSHDPPEVLEDSELRTVVRLCHRTGSTEVHEVVSIDRRHGRVATALNAEVRDRHLVVRWELPTTLTTAAAEAEGLWGMSRHPTVPEGLNDQAAFEWAAHRFVSLAEQHVGVAIANDGRYGHSVDGGRLGVTLSTAPLFPDPDADQMPASVNLLIMPHDGRWADVAVHGAAHAWSHGVRGVVRPDSAAGLFNPVGGLPDSLQVLGVWPATDGEDLIVILGEVYGSAVTARVKPMMRQYVGVEGVDLVSEESLCAGTVSWDGRAATVSLGPFAVSAVRFRSASRD